MMLTIEKIENMIFQIRGRKVILDSDLASLYEVSTKVLIQSVKRHPGRFPKDFMFILTRNELNNLRSQIVTSSWGGRRYLPHAFTEQGVAMLSSVLNSTRAIEVNIAIMRAFVQLRRIGLTYVGLKRKMEEMEKKYDGQFGIVFSAIRKLFELPIKKKRTIIGFRQK